MQSTLTKWIFLTCLCLGATSPALAEVTYIGDGTQVAVSDDTTTKLVGDTRTRKVRKTKGTAVVYQVPELDPNAAGLALVLLAGGTLLMVDRRRRVRV